MSMLPFESATTESRNPLEAQTGTEALEEYFALRQSLGEINRPDGEELSTMQEKVGKWLSTEGPLADCESFDEAAYAISDMGQASAKISALSTYLTQNFPDRVSPRELEVTDRFLSTTALLHQETPVDDSIHTEADGSFGFVVPARMSRKNKAYGQEVETVLPTFRYVPRELRAAMMVGLPPFVIDTYKPDSEGKRGYLIFAPVYPDMYEDLGTVGALRAGRKQVDAAISFAHGRFGTEIVGLGAILPAITNYGKSIKHPGVITTTGHGGTIELILKTVHRAEAEGRVSEAAVRKIGVLGLGSIGVSIAGVIRDTYPHSELFVYDKGEQAAQGELKTQTIAAHIGAVAAKDAREVLENTNIIISAVTDKISLAELGVSDLSGKLLIDDSQPGAFDVQEVRDHGAALTWVVGRDGDNIMRSEYTYGDTLAAPNDLFGCEAEAATLAAYYADLLHDGVPREIAREQVRAIAIREAVTPQHVRGISNLFARYGVTAAPAQVFGRYL